MDDLIYEQYTGEKEDIDKYLSQSITTYGLAQHKDETPVKLFCICKNYEGVILGAVMGQKTLNLCFISHIYVEEKYRNMGIGSSLLTKIGVKAKNVGCTMLRLNTFNDLSHHFYEKNGFSITTRITKYMNGFDLVYYEKSIS